MQVLIPFPLKFLFAIILLVLLGGLLNLCLLGWISGAGEAMNALRHHGGHHRRFP